MADGVVLSTGNNATPPNATTVATDDAGAAGHVQIVKLAVSNDGVATVIPADTGYGLDVDVTRLPALVAGSAVIGKVSIDQTTPGTTNLVDTELPAAAALSSDAVASPTAPAVGGFVYLWNGATWDRVPGSTAGLFAQGNVAHDAVDSGNPLKMGGRASSTIPAAVSDGDRTNIWTSQSGAVEIAGVQATGADSLGVNSTVSIGHTINSAGPMQAVMFLYNGSSWDRIRGDITNGVDVDVTRLPTQAFSVATTITRPANATPYTLNDVLGGAIDLGVLGPSGLSVMITDVTLEYDVAALPAGFSATLHLYNVTPPSATADNGAWDLPSGDRASYLGYIPLVTPTDLGSTLYGQFSGVNKRVKLSGTHLFGYLVVTAFTPAGNSEVLVLTVATMAI